MLATFAFDVCHEVYCAAREVLDGKIATLNLESSGKYVWRPDRVPRLAEFVADFVRAGERALGGGRRVPARRRRGHSEERFAPSEGVLKSDEESLRDLCARTTKTAERFLAEFPTAPVVAGTTLGMTAQKNHARNDSAGDGSQGRGRGMPCPYGFASARHDDEGRAGRDAAGAGRRGGTPCHSERRESRSEESLRQVRLDDTGTRREIPRVVPGRSLCCENHARNDNAEGGRDGRHLGEIPHSGSAFVRNDGVVEEAIPSDALRVSASASLGTASSRNALRPSRLVLFQMFYLGGAEYQAARRHLGISEFTWADWAEEVRKRVGAELVRAGMFPPSKYFLQGSERNDAGSAA